MAAAATSRRGAAPLLRRWGGASIAAPNSANGEDLNRDFYAAAGEPKVLWEIPESGHVGGLKARPREYERRVIAFYEEALLG